ncbi:MAG: phospholipase A [Wenzhouxiangellaceae bacterium]|nr:phospholipase A [Wenzhouxiangellaceae bacterium]
MSPLPRPMLCLLAVFTAIPLRAEDIDPQEAVDACRVVEDPLRRLACYDRIPGADVTAQDELAETLEMFPDETVPVAAAATVDDTPVNRSRMMRRWELDDATHGGRLRVRRHEPVYLLPGRWSSDPNDNPATPNQPRPARRPDLDAIEVKFQLSLKTKVADNLFGNNGDVWVGFTQQSNWQAYNSVESEPFRETNYAPEAMLAWRTGLDLFGWRWQMLNLGFVHQSNGRADPLSRSWNRLYAMFGFERGNFEVYARPWLRVEADGDDDNPDIEDFLGHGDVRVIWRRGKHDVSFLGRYAPDDNRGAIQADWHWPLRGDLKAYLQVFHGYGETLIDYNHRQTTIGLGVSLVQ